MHQRTSAATEPTEVDSTILKERVIRQHEAERKLDVERADIRSHAEAVNRPHKDLTARASELDYLLKEERIAKEEALRKLQQEMAAHDSFRVANADVLEKLKEERDRVLRSVVFPVLCADCLHRVLGYLCQGRC